ncbi:unnamed protein product, partial [Polarella glacialis]
MKSFHVCLLAAFICEMDAAECPANYVEIGTSCYSHTANKGSWAEVRQMCQQQGTDLVVINDRNEDDLVTGMCGQNCWVGLSQVETINWEGRAYIRSWSWVNGEGVQAYSNWAKGLPSEGGDFQKFVYKSNGEWHAGGKNDIYHGFCEKQGEAAPATAGDFFSEAHLHIANAVIAGMGVLTSTVLAHVVCRLRARVRKLQTHAASLEEGNYVIGRPMAESML